MNMHRSLSGTISCVTGRIRFLPVTMTGSFSNQLCKSESTKIVFPVWKHVLINSQYLSDVICTFIRQFIYIDLDIDYLLKHASIRAKQT